MKKRGLTVQGAHSPTGVQTPGRAPSIRAQWAAIGGIGRVAAVGLALSLVLALLLGFSIPNVVERRLVEAHAGTFEAVVADLASENLIESSDGTIPDMAALDEAVRDRLLGVDVVRVKVWDTAGTIVYSDLPELVGLSFPLTEGLAAAFGGDFWAGHAEERAESATERVVAHVWEFYLPIVDESSGGVTAVLEVYEATPELHTALASIRRWVWFSVGSGLAVLLAFNVSLIAANIKALTRRRSQAEHLFADLARAQEEERSRIVGALHDDIGQPLYRVLYGIQGSQSQVDPTSPVGVELGKVADLVRWIDGTLRTELGMLQLGVIGAQDLDALLTRLASDVRRESSVDVSLTIEEHGPLSDAVRTALFQAAREAVNNARKHSGAREIAINISRRRHDVVLDVVDKGIGFNGDIGLGLATTRSRLEAIGGGLRVTKAPGGGTRFRAWAPEPAGEDA